MPGRSPLTVPSRLRGVFGFDSFEAEDAPGDPEGWSRAFQELIKEMEEQFPERWGTGDLDQWLRDPQVRAGIRPLVADRAVTAQFLASKGIVLTAEARELFLDCVTENYIDALSLLIRRAKGDYSSDDLPRQFPQFTRERKTQAAGLSPWALFEQWVTGPIGNRTLA